MDRPTQLLLVRDLHLQCKPPIPSAKYPCQAKLNHIDARYIYIYIYIYIIYIYYIYMFISISMYLSLSIYIYLYLYLYLSIPIYTYLSIYPILSFYPSILLSFFLSIYPSIHLSIYPSIHLSIYPSIHLSIYLSLYMYILSVPMKCDLGSRPARSRTRWLPEEAERHYIELRAEQDWAARTMSRIWYHMDVGQNGRPRGPQMLV